MGRNKDKNNIYIHEIWERQVFRKNGTLEKLVWKPGESSRYEKEDQN